MDTAAERAPVAGARHILLTDKQLMSLFGFVPLAVYVVLHLWTNLTSLGGATAWTGALLRSRGITPSAANVPGALPHHPAFLFLEVFGLGLPLLVHAWIGLKIVWRALRGAGNTVHYGYFRNLKFWLQRISGLGLLAFLGAHIYLARIVPATTAGSPGYETFYGFVRAMHEPDTYIVYALGILGISYHLANGMWSFCMTWGLTVSPRSQKVAEGLSALFFVILLAMGAGAMYGFLRVPVPA